MIATARRKAIAESTTSGRPTVADGQDGTPRISAPCAARKPTTPCARTQPPTPAPLASASAIAGEAAAPAAMNAPGRERVRGTVFSPLGYSGKIDVGRFR